MVSRFQAWGFGEAWCPFFCVSHLQIHIVVAQGSLREQFSLQPWRGRHCNLLFNNKVADLSNSRPCCPQIPNLVLNPKSFGSTYTDRPAYMHATCLYSFSLHAEPGSRTLPFSAMARPASSAPRHQRGSLDTREPR